MKTRHALGLTAAVGACGLVLNRLVRASRAIDFAGASVLIFGGSRGLGLEIARQLAAEHAHVLLAARDNEELERARADLAARGLPAATLACDIRDRRQVEAAISRMVDEYGTIDVLINDAGIIQVGPIEHMTVADFEDAMATHFWGPLFAIQAALPHMRRGGARRIVNISSIGGKIAVPHLVPYTASKFALTGLSEGLRAELAREGFAVTTVCPGLMRTGSTYNARFKGNHRREFTWFHLADSMPGLSIAARRAARQVINACRYGDPELIITPAARLAIALNGIAPSVTARLLSTANRLMPAPAGESGNEMRSGWQSTSKVAPSFVTKLADRASAENNELPGNGPSGR
jgi:NAD(P)-dependent dehydrogenase (short-subunit alcohol dehydrogenase family)